MSDASGQPLPAVDAAKLLAWLESRNARYRRERFEALARNYEEQAAVLAGMRAMCVGLVVLLETGLFAPDGEEVAP